MRASELVFYEWASAAVVEGFFMISRREALLGVIGLVASAVTVSTALSLAASPAPTEPRFCINPWGGHDSIVSPSEIRKAQLITAGRGTPSDWLDIETTDGRIIQSELAGSQPNIYDLVAQLEAHGVYVWKVETLW
jgi:hypothetical protein